MAKRVTVNLIGGASFTVTMNSDKELNDFRDIFFNHKKRGNQTYTFWVNDNSNNIMVRTDQIQVISWKDVENV